MNANTTKTPSFSVTFLHTRVKNMENKFSAWEFFFFLYSPFIVVIQTDQYFVSPSFYNYYKKYQQKVWKRGKFLHILFITGQKVRSYIRTLYIQIWYFYFKEVRDELKMATVFLNRRDEDVLDIELQNQTVTSHWIFTPLEFENNKIQIDYSFFCLRKENLYSTRKTWNNITKQS